MAIKCNCVDLVEYLALFHNFKIWIDEIVVNHCFIFSDVQIWGGGAVLDQINNKQSSISFTRLILRIKMSIYNVSENNSFLPFIVFLNQVKEKSSNTVALVHPVTQLVDVFHLFHVSPCSPCIPCSHVLHVLHVLETFSMFSNPGLQESLICGALIDKNLCHGN